MNRPPQAYPVEQGMIRSFVQAVGDANPLWQDEKHATKSNYGGIIAPPTFALILGFEQMLQVLTAEPEVTVLHGGTNLECFATIRPGDTIALTSRITNVRERPGKTGRTAFVTFEISCHNQKLEMVARCRQMAIIY